MFLHHVIAIYVLIPPHVASPPHTPPPATPLSPSNDASPTTPSASPRAFAFGAHKPQCLQSGPNGRKYTPHAAYNELVASTTPTMSHPPPPPRSCFVTLSQSLCKAYTPA
ncbi:hypothetical protein B0H14DRAFT_3515096 [Mycena olivaceomarginata]|nr:hypothetical protein B0H14DRAFT_3515096 [Mycena olivaceomarginata]